MSNAKKSALASLLLVSESLAQKLIGLASTLVLARFLIPEDFGIIAIATLSIYLAEVLSDTGSQQYVLRADKVDDDVINTSFTINVVFRASFSMLIILAAPLIASYYEDPRLSNVIYVLAGLTMLNCIRNPGLWLLKREQQYAQIVKWSLIGKCLSVCVSIVSAILLKSYWALLLAQLTNSAFMLLTSYFIHSFRPKFAIVNARQQWRFSLWVMPQSLLGYIRTQFDSLFVSTLFSQAALGSYHTMKYLAYIPCSHILEPATRPLLVELSKIKNNRSYFATQFNVTLLIVMSLALPITSYLYFFRDIVVGVVLGENWAAYSHLFGILCLVIPSYLMFHQSNRAVYAYGQTKIAAAYEFFSISTLVAILLIFQFDSVEHFAKAKLWFETTASIAYLMFVSAKYNGIKSTVRLVVMHTPIFLSCYCAVLIAINSPKYNHPLVDLMISGTCFLSSFILTISLLIFLLRKINNEWAYIYNLVGRGARSVLQKVNRAE